MRGRKGVPMDSQSDDDTLSTTSGGSSLELGGRVEELDAEPLLESFVDALFEKRASIRECALRNLLGAFTSSVLVDFVADNYETLLHRFLFSLKKGSATERALAARAIGLLALTAGPSEIANQIMEEAWPFLSKVAKLDSSPSARVSALDTMGIVPFVGDVELEIIENSMETIWQICSHKGNYHSEQVKGTNKPSGAVKCAAISAWALLLSTVPRSRIANYHVSLSLPTLSNLLKDDDSSVKKAAGEAVALLYDSITDLEDGFAFRTIDEISDNPALAVPKSEITLKLVASGGKGLEATETKVVEQMKALSLQAGGKGQSRKERYSERSAFKDLICNMEYGECRETSVKLRGGDYLRINNWTHTIQLKALRHILAEGFQCHLQDNELLHQIFEYQPRGQTRKVMSKKQKRLYMSPNSVISKARTQIRNSNRSKVQADNEGHYNINFNDV